MKQLRERGDPARYHGQIGRSQTHYTVDDYPLMQRVFEESLWPILQEKLRQKGVRVGAAPAAQEPAPMPARQPRIHEFFRNDGRGEM